MKHHTLGELYGSVPNLTNGMDSVEWVRRYREGYDAGQAALRAKIVAKLEGERDASAKLPAYNDITHAQQQGEQAAFDRAIALVREVAP